MAGGRGSWLSTATALFFGWALLSFTVRIWVTLGRKQSWNHSDSGVVGAVLVAIFHVGSNFWAIHHGYGRPSRALEQGDMVEIEKALFASQLSYVGAVGLTRVSTAFFVGHLTRHPPQVRVSYILAAVSGFWAVVAILVIALRPNLARPWATLDGAESLYRRWIAVEATGLAVEVAIWGLSISLVWGLQMKLRKRLLILTVFACRLLLIPIVAFRLYYLSPGENYDPTVTSIIPHILTEGAMNYAIVATSITALKPFLKPFHSGAIVNTVGGTGSGLYSGSQSGPQGLYMLSSVARDKKPTGSTTMDSTRSENERDVLQPQQKLYTGNRGEGTTAISSRTDPQREDMGSMESHGSEQMIIRTQREWTVRYENS